MTDIIKPTNEMTDAELLAAAEALEAEAREHEEHAREIETYIAARSASKERAGDPIDE